MHCTSLEKRIDFLKIDTKEKDSVLYYDLGPFEIALIMGALILIFGVSKLGQIGGALGKSIREFREERDGIDYTAQSTISENGIEEDTHLK